MVENQRVIVLLGCSRGIGRAVLDFFAGSHSCKALVGIARNSVDVAKLEAAFSNNRKVHFLQGDVTDAALMHRVAGKVGELGLVPDLLICNAGVLTTPRPFYEVSAKEMWESFNVNVIGCLNSMTAFLPLMRKVEGAVIVNVSSGWGLFGGQGQTTYVAAKHGLEGLMKCAAMEVAADEVAIVTVRPGIVVTDMLATAMGGMDTAVRMGVAVEQFAPHFCEKLLRITKADSGSHIDCGYKYISSRL
jgi:3alpha(or 20beta)-hydroxysteroid dehydrogenase